MTRILAVLAATMMLSACITTADNRMPAPQIGTVYSGAAPSPYGDVLLPPGNWIFVGASTSQSSNSQLFANGVLARVDSEKNLDGLVMYSAALEGSRNNIPKAAQTYCNPKAKTLYAEQSPPSAYGFQECFFIEDWPLNAGGDATPHVKQAERYFKTHAVRKPNSMLFSNYLISNDKKRLVAHYGFNYRQPVGDVIPGFTPSEKFVYDHPFGTEGWKTNLETVVSWSKENEPKITKAFLK